MESAICMATRRLAPGCSASRLATTARTALARPRAAPSRVRVQRDPIRRKARRGTVRSSVRSGYVTLLVHEVVSFCRGVRGVPVCAACGDVTSHGCRAHSYWYRIVVLSLHVHAEYFKSTLGAQLNVDHLIHPESHSRASGHFLGRVPCDFTRRSTSTTYRCFARSLLKSPSS
jgi:hypothetical protein